MALRHQWLSQARIELDETLDYLFYEFGGQSAEKLYIEVEKCVKRLCLFPDLGMRYKDLVYKEKGVRILHMDKSSIIYCHDDDVVIILAFWNNRNDDSFLAEMLSER